uniref:Secreted protein n=1 Tax=Neobacillus citreus TaxID=2833578 RepID=A0A942SXR6_9BACI
MTCKQRNGAMTAAVVAALTAATILGTALPAQAASGVGAQVRTPEDASAESGQEGTPGWSTIVRSAMNAQEMAASIWETGIDGVEEASTTFQSEVWPAIRANVGGVSRPITTWGIWKFCD